MNALSRTVQWPSVMTNGPLAHEDLVDPLIPNELGPVRTTNVTFSPAPHLVRIGLFRPERFVTKTGGPQ